MVEPDDSALPFLPLNDNISSSPVQTINGDETTTQSVIIGTPIIIGDNLFTQLHIGTNGIVSLQNTFKFSFPSHFPTNNPDIKTSNVFAPYWSNTDVRSEGSVSFQSYSSSSVQSSEQERLNEINGFILGSQNESFSAILALLVDWNSVHPFDHEIFLDDPSQFSTEIADFLNSTNTFQAIIATDSFTTYVIYTYECGMLSWTGSGDNHAVIGYNIQGLTPHNEPLSGTEFVNDIACNDPSSDYVNVVYKFTANPDTPYLQCLAAKNQDIQTISPAEFQLGYNFLLGLDCPCSLFQVRRDGRFFFINFSPDSQPVLCYTQLFGFGFGVPKRCCYSSDSNDFGALITSGHYRSSSLSANPIFQQTQYLENDVSFFEKCCIEGDFCEEYLERRRTHDCLFYIPPFFSWFWGDPHIHTLDDRSYTFNGLGEYVMANVNNSLFMLQGRTRLAAVNSTATVFTAFAAADHNGTHVQVEIGSDPDMMVIRVNGEDVTMSLNDTLFMDTLSLQRTSNTSISATFPSTISLGFSLRSGTLATTVLVPEKFRGDVVGLLGNFDGDSTNDFIYRNNLTSVSNDISDREKHKVAQTWQITQEESLFFYDEGDNVSTFSFPNHIPIFLDELSNETLTSAVDVCGEGNIECIFDFSQTGNEDIARSTLQTNNENMMDEEILLNFPPTISGLHEFRINLNEPSLYIFNASDPGDTFNVTIDFTGSPTPEFQLIEGVAEDGLYTLNVTLLSVQSMTVSITATDSRNASTSLVPQIEICGCVNGGKCTREGIVELSANPLTLICLCPEAYTGDFCELDVDGCALESCFMNAQCTDVPAPMIGISCPPCPSGFVGNGKTCFDIDECGTGSDNCDQLCSNTQGSFQCGCMAGFSLSQNGFTCENINECTLNQDDCQQICNDLEGSFNCSCRVGFDLEIDGRTCTIDPDRECPDNNDCDQLCILQILQSSGSIANSSADIECSCMKGFKLVNESACVDVDECASNTTNPCEQICTNNIGNFTCSCLEGYTQSGFMCNDINECIDPDECGDLQTCINTEGGSFCECQQGFTLNQTTNECDDINECETESPCDQICTNTIGLFECSCNSGFTLAQDKLNCTDINECSVSIPCEANQTCINTDGSFLCKCLTDFVLVNETCVSVPQSTSSTLPSYTTTTVSITPSSLAIPSTSSSIITRTLSTSTTVSTVIKSSFRTSVTVTTPTQSPAQPSELVQTVDVILLRLSESEFDEEARLRFRVTVAEAIDKYCSESGNECDLLSISDQQRKRQTTSIILYEADDVFIVRTSQSGSSLIVTFFVRGTTPGTVLPPDTIVTSLEEQTQLFLDANFMIDSIRVSDTREEDNEGLSGGQITGIVIAVIVLVVLFTILATVAIWFLWRKQRSYSLTKRDFKDDIVIKNANYIPSKDSVPGFVNPRFQ